MEPKMNALSEEMAGAQFYKASGGVVKTEDSRPLRFGWAVDAI